MPILLFHGKLGIYINMLRKRMIIYHRRYRTARKKRDKRTEMDRNRGKVVWRLNIYSSVYRRILICLRQQEKLHQTVNERMTKI